MNELLFIVQSLFLSIICLVIIGWHVSIISVYVSLLAILANIFVTKQIMLGSWHATPSDALIIGGSLALNLIQEYHGAQAARRALLTSFGAALLYLVMVEFYLAYEPTLHDTMQGPAQLLLKNTPRIIAASLVSFLISGFLDYYVFGWLKATQFRQILDSAQLYLCSALPSNRYPAV